MKKIMKVMFIVMAFFTVSSVSADCWNVVNQFGVDHVHCVPGEGAPAGTTWAHCWINPEGVQVCNGPAPSPNCWINANGVQVCGQPHCWINPNGVQVCN